MISLYFVSLSLSLSFHSFLSSLLTFSLVRWKFQRNYTHFSLFFYNFLLFTLILLCIQSFLSAMWRQNWPFANRLAFHCVYQLVYFYCYLSLFYVSILSETLIICPFVCFYINDTCCKYVSYETTIQSSMLLKHLYFCKLKVSTKNQQSHKL